MNKIEEIEAFEIFPWNENFETGINEIDEQHKKLIILLNKLANTLTQEKEYEVEETFNELANYAEYHFKCEEEIWNKYLKDELLVLKHKDTHSSFLPKVIELKENNKDKSFHEIVEDILLFLIRWLAFHIIDEDKRLAFIIKAIEEDNKDIKEAIYQTDNIMSGSMKNLLEAILKMYDNLSLKAISLIRERKARVKAQKELKEINKKLEQLSITDQLTDLYNRRYFEETFEKELKRTKRDKKFFGVILFDIDYFKKLNDHYGHLEGDEALKSISNCLKNTCKRPSDFIFRIGGEEFCIISINEKKEDIYNLANIVQQSINEMKIENIKSLVSDYLTISAGVESLIPTNEDNIDTIMKNADEKLYKAKENGRDRIVF